MPPEPISDATLVSWCHQTGDGGAFHNVSLCQETGDKASPDSKALDSEKLDSKAITQDACAAMRKWPDIKRELQNRFPLIERSRIRPLLLLKELSGGVLLLALPPNGAIVGAVRSKKEIITEIIQQHSFKGFALTKYPEEHELDVLARRSPDWADVAERIRKGRLRKSERRTSQRVPANPAGGLDAAQRCQWSPDQVACHPAPSWNQWAGDSSRGPRLGY